MRINQDYLVIGSICDFLLAFSEQGCVQAGKRCCRLATNPYLTSAFHCRVRVRYQKRQKLQFETKLGMNSPFWLVPSVQGTTQSSNPVTSQGQNENPVLKNKLLRSNAAIRRNRYQPNLTEGGCDTNVSRTTLWGYCLKDKYILLVHEGQRGEDSKAIIFKKEPKIGNYLLFGFRVFFKAWECFVMSFFFLLPLVFISERLVHACSQFQQLSWSRKLTESRFTFRECF